MGYKMVDLGRSDANHVIIDLQLTDFDDFANGISDALRVSSMECCKGMPWCLTANRNLSPGGTKYLEVGLVCQESEYASWDACSVEAIVRVMSFKASEFDISKPMRARFFTQIGVTWNCKELATIEVSNYDALCSKKAYVLTMVETPKCSV